MTKREKILDSALACMVEYGVKETPVSLIADRAGVATGTIYHYFENKSCILKTLFLEERKKFAEAISLAIDKNSSLEQQFRDGWYAIYWFYIKHQPSFKFHEQMIRSNELSFETKLEVVDSYLVFKELIENGIAHGYFEKMRPSILIELVHAHISSAVGLLVYHHVSLTKEDLEELYRVSLKSVKQETFMLSETPVAV